MRNSRWIWLLLFALPTVASANGAMGLGLERWDLRYWYAYVLVMVVAEAWLIGRWLELSWVKSIGLSLLANAVTGLCGGFGCFAAAMHTSFAGSSSNPNPILDSLAILIYFAIPSALIEYLFWNMAKGAAMRPGKLWRVIWVHFALVPVGMVILLIPDRPYPGLENFTAWHRMIQFRWIGKELRSYIETNSKLPTGKTPEEICHEVVPIQSDKEDLVLALYRPVYHRFSTGDDRLHPLEINADALGLKISEKSKVEWIWLIRPPLDMPWGRQIDVNIQTGEVRDSARK